MSVFNAFKKQFTFHINPKIQAQIAQTKTHEKMGHSLKEIIMMRTFKTSKSFSAS
jgi:hypothetical protein